MLFSLRNKIGISFNCQTVFYFGGDLDSNQTHSNPFFDQPILNSPYIMPARHWELDAEGQPTQKIIGTRRRADFITPIPKPKKRKINASQEQLVFDEGKGLSTRQQQYDPTSIINEVRDQVETWRSLPNTHQWQVTPENRSVASTLATSPILRLSSILLPGRSNRNSDLAD